MQRLLIYQHKDSGEICDFTLTEEFDPASLYSQGRVYVDCDEDAWIIQSDCQTRLGFETVNELPRIEGLVPVITVDENNQALMAAFTNKAALEETMNSKIACYFSRSRGKFWKKGEESGHTQEILGIKFDRTKNLLLYKVKQNKAACHTGFYSCFYRERDQDGDKPVFQKKIFNPDEVYKNE